MKKEIFPKPESENRVRRFKMKTTWLVFLLMLLGGAADVCAQSALDGFDPSANGQVRVVVVQPDGKVLIGGDFTTVTPNGGPTVTRNRIARLNPDGTLDTVFNPSANSSVDAIVVLADGKILVGGAFNGANSIGGQPRNRIARLDPIVGSADSWVPNANGEVYAIAVQADGKILAGGLFLGANSIGGQTRNRIARLDATTGAADSFDPNANSDVRALVVQADGRILAGGLFNGANSIGGQTRNRIARLNPVTGAADSFDPNANNNIRSIALQADGKVLIGGDFTALAPNGGAVVTRNRIARLDPATGAADSFNPNASFFITSIAVQADGKILVGGAFTQIGGQPRNFLARLNSASGLAD
ncbi:MAG: delta-60 repeat domain-containing protein, partial [Verrucomicrobiota bacterium]|nr:delta-60 repeat domain-containing protein [Verrucomicrobiota bacterium]